MKTADKTAMIANAEFEEFLYRVPTIPRRSKETGLPVDANQRIKDWEEDVLGWHRSRSHMLK